MYCNLLEPNTVLSIIHHIHWTRDKTERNIIIRLLLGQQQPCHGSYPADFNIAGSPK